MWQKGHSPVPGYKLEKFLGRGNFGEVWQSSSPGGTKCALKFLNLHEKQGRKEFRAIQRLKQIRHAHLLPINAMWLLDENQRVLPEDSLESTNTLMEDTHRQTLVLAPAGPESGRPGTLIIAMPLGQQNLLELLNERKQQGKDIPIDELLVYMMDAARALDYLNTPKHDLGEGLVSVQHGDVKPENLLLLGGSVVLCDFGVARTLGGTSNNRATTLGGSLAYIAPECLAGKTSTHSDQFSLAMSYVELRTGELPFQDSSVSDLIESRKKGELDLDKLPPREQKVIRRATALNPDKRFSSNVEMVESLQAALLGPATVTSGKNRGLVAVIGALLCMTLISLAFALFGPLRNGGSEKEEREAQEGGGSELPGGGGNQQAQEADDPKGAQDIEPPLEMQANDHLRKALTLVAAPRLDAIDVTQATQEYVTAIELGLSPELPTPERFGIPASELEEHYSVMQQEVITQTFAVSPSGEKTVVVGRSGRSILELLQSSETSDHPLGFGSPIVSVAWLDAVHLVVRNDDRELWLVSMESGKQPKLIANGINGIATVAVAGKGLAVAAREVTLFSAMENLVIPSANRELYSPLVSLTQDAQWGMVTEEFVQSDSSLLLDLSGTPQATALSSLTIKPLCAVCTCVGDQCFGIVGGDSAKSNAGLAIVPLVNGIRDVVYPGIFDSDGVTADAHQRKIRSLAVALPLAASQATITFAAGQDGYFTETDLWSLKSTGAVEYLGTRGQPLESAITCLAFDPSGQWLVRGTEYGEVILTDINRNLDYPLLNDNDLTRVMQLQFVGNRLLAAFSHGVTVLRWNFGECMMVINACEQTNSIPKVPSLVNYEG